MNLAVTIEHGRLYHNAIPKTELRALALRSTVIPASGFRTVAEYLAALDSDPRDVITLEPCDHQNARGVCQGHALEFAETD